MGLGSLLNFSVADAMNMPFTNGSFDLSMLATFYFELYNVNILFYFVKVWSMESGEHMPDKKLFVGELLRVTSSGGRLIVVTWCKREDKDKPLTYYEERLLSKICDAYYLPQWVSASKYDEISKELGLQDFKCEDWTQFVIPFWGAVIRSAFSPLNLLRLLWGGWTTVKAGIAAVWMLRGIQEGVIKFIIFTGKKEL